MTIDFALAFGATLAFAFYLCGVLIVRDTAKEQGYRHNLWTVIVASTVNLGLLAYYIRVRVDQKGVMNR